MDTFVLLTLLPVAYAAEEPLRPEFDTPGADTWVESILTMVGETGNCIPSLN